MEPQIHGDGEGKLPADYVRKAVQFVINTHAATVNMRLYPPTSSMVNDTLKQAQSRLSELLEQREMLSVGAVEGKILINGVQLEDLEQQRPPIRSFIEWMNERGLSNIEFSRGVTLEELHAALDVVGRISTNPEIKEDLTGELSRKGVSNISINQRVYVAVTPGMEAFGRSSAISGIGRKATPLEALKDELLVRYLMGKVSISEVEEGELAQILSDPEKIAGLLSSFIAHEGSEGGVFVRSRKAEESLNRLVEMANEVGDEGLRSALIQQITEIIAEMTPLEMTTVLSSDSAVLDIENVRKNVLEMLSDRQLFDLVDSLMVEYLEMRDQIGTLDRDWARDKLRRMNELLLDLKGGIRGETISEEIDRRLEEANIPEERDPSTGKKVLSAYQLLGGELGEEDIADISFGDEAITSQVRELFEMGEEELTSGMLVKLADNLGAESEKVRRYMAHLIKETVSKLESEEALLAARVLGPALEEAIGGEDDYQTFVHETEALGMMTEIYLREGLDEEAAEVIKCINRVSSPEARKGAELRKHAQVVLESLIGPGGLVDAASLPYLEDREKKIFSIRVLSRLGPEAFVPLVELVKESSEIDIQGKAFEALRMAGSAGLGALISELKKPNPWYVYRNVLRLLGELRDPEAVEEISMMASHKDERVRVEVIRALAKIGSRESVEFIMGAIADPSPAVRRTAVRKLGSFGDPIVGDFLVDVIEKHGRKGKGESEGLAEAAILALGDLKDPKYLQYLSGILEKGGVVKKARPLEMRAAAALALGKMGDPAAIPVLEKAARDQSLLVRKNAESALETIRKSGKATT